jgi:predicted kinase
LLIVFAGPPCSGKSTLAAALAQHLELPHLSMDATRRRILPNAAHTRTDRQAAYRAMHFAAELLLRAGAGVILDAPYGHAEDREELARVAALADYRLIECKVSPETAAQRFRARGPDPECPDLNEDVVRLSAERYAYTGAGLLLDTEVEPIVGPDGAILPAALLAAVRLNGGALRRRTTCRSLPPELL